MHPCLAAYLKLCRRFQFSPPWDGCSADERSLFGPSDPKAALIDLSAEFSAEQLVDSGIARFGVEERLTLHPMLATPDVVIITLLDTATGELRNLMTETGCVFGADASAFQVLGDKHTFNAVANDRTVFLTATIADTVLLRSFGLAAAPTVDLVRLNQHGIELLCEYYGCTQNPSEREEEELVRQTQAEDREVEAPGSAAGAAPDHVPSVGPNGHSNAHTGVASAPPSLLVPDTGYLGTEDEDFIKLVVVRWSPQSVSSAEAPPVKRAIEELKGLQRHRRLDIHEINQWIPSDSDLEKIRFALERKDATWARDALLDSIYSGVRSLGSAHVASAKVAPAADFAGAVKELQEALLGGSEEPCRQNRKEALCNYARVVAASLTGPMMRQAEAIVDPFDRALLLQFVQLNALFMDKAPLVREQALQRLTAPRQESLKDGGDKSVAELLAISSQIVSLAKEMKWKTRLTTAPGSLPAAKTHPSRRFAASDLALKN